MFRQDFTCPALLEDANVDVAYGALTRLWPVVPNGSATFIRTTGLIRVRSPLLTESR